MEVKLDNKDFERLLGYCLHHKNNGRMKYFYEVSIPDSFYSDFLKWLEKCDDALLSYAFVVIRCYEGHRLLYGFTNFEVGDDFTYRSFDFKFENDDILSKKFRKWKQESECMLVPFSLLGYFKVMDTIDKHYDNIKPLVSDETE